MQVAVDTNILAYAEGVNGVERRDIAVDLLEWLPDETALIPVQVLGELFNVLVRKAGKSTGQARATILSWRDAFPVIETSGAALWSAIDLAHDHRLAVWDALILSVAAEAGCRLLLSEDMQDGFTWRGVTVANPFADQQQPLLVGLLRG
jgi:predicted nucleic acid-binding protein